MPSTFHNWISGSTILVVEDEPAQRRLLRRWLERLQCRIFEVDSGEKALEAMDAHRPDLVVLDVNLPGMSGLEVCQLMRADPDLVEVPVIVVTGHSQDAMQLQALEAGADDFVSRPFNGKVLVARVSTQLARSRMEEENRRLRGNISRFPAAPRQVTAAILCADLQRMGAVPAKEALERRREFDRDLRAVLAAHSGWIALPSGLDLLLLWIGEAAAHEAWTVLKELQSRASRPPLALHHGEVVLARLDPDQPVALGEDLRVASTLAQQAAPGEVLVSAATLQAMGLPGDELIKIEWEGGLAQVRRMSTPYLVRVG